MIVYMLLFMMLSAGYRLLSEKGRGAAFIITFPIPDKEIWKTEYYL